MRSLPFLVCAAVLSVSQAAHALTVTPVSQTNVACFGGNTGAAKIAISGASGFLIIDWSGTPSGDHTTQVTGLSAGFISVYVEDDFDFQIVNFNITGPSAALNATAVVSNSSTCTANNGSINLTPSGGTAPYTFNWGGGITSEDRTNLAAGDYTVVITDVNGCSTSKTYTVGPPKPSISFVSQTNVSCNGGSNGALSVSATGGTGTLGYNWTPGNPIGDGTGSVTGLTAQAYTITVTDTNGCTAAQTYTVTQPSTAISGTTVVTNASCNGSTNGAINLTPTGGVSPYTFNWSGGVTTEDRTGLAAGAYPVTITDANGCQGTVTPVVTQPPVVTGSTVLSNVACFGGSNGFINLTPSGGTGPYTFNWGGGVTTEDRTSLTAGSYSVTITDANGCQGTVARTITQPAAAVSGTTVVTNVACFGGSNGAINFTPSGGTGPYTYQWLPSGPTTEDRTGLVAGTYNVLVTDVNGCTGTVGATVTQPTTPVSGTTVVTNVACFGGNTGAINLTPSGGSGPYTFDWGGGVTTEDRTGLAAGTYSVTVTDANGCTGTVPRTVTQPAAAVSGSTVITNVACFGGNTGAVNLTPSGGTGPYTYSWNTGQTTEDRTNLAAGSYSVTITDANGCQGTASPTISQPTAAVGGTSVVTNVACFGGSNGAINFTPSGGTGPYTYQWLPGGPTTEDRTGLSAGTYNVQVTDVNGCTGTVPTTVTQPTAAVSGTTVVTNVACFGGNTGAVNLTPTGGTGPYTFNWLPSGPTTEDRTGLVAGSYSVQITDANGCTGTVAPTVTQPTTPVSGTTTVTNVACFGGNTGAINLTPTGGVGPYTYDWGGGVTTEDRTLLVAGSYSVTVTDANGCTGVVPRTVTQPASAVSTSTVVTNVACFAGSNGAINLTPSGGTAPYTFNWGGGVTTEDRTGLAAGSYSVNVTDVNGCTATGSATVTQPAAAVAATTVTTNVACFGGNTGAINLTPTGGVGPYTYSWNGGITTEDRTGLPAGTQSVVVTDANGCTASASATVTEPATAVTGSVAVTNIACFGGNTGAINLTPTGGVGPYTYNWGGGITSEDRSSLGAGSYSVVVTDANGCTDLVSTAVTQPTAPLGGSTVVTNVACFGGSSGAVNLTPTGGTGPYTFDWGSGVMTEDRAALAAGPYSVMITDANGCSELVNATVTQPGAALAGSIASTNVACFAGNTGAANLTATGGTPPYSYNWGGGVNTEDRTGLAAGSYAVTIEDVNGCTATASTSITEPATAVSLTVSSTTNLTCFEDNSGQATVVGAGGTGAYTYAWSHGPTTPSVTGLAAQDYVVSVTDSNGCSASTTIAPTEPDELNIDVDTLVNVACFGDSTASATVKGIGGTGDYTYEWSHGPTTASVTGLSAADYTVKVTDENGCIANKTITPTEPPQLFANISSQTNIACFGGSNGTATVAGLGGTPGYTYSWNNGATVATATGLSATSYTATVTDANGCVATKGVTLTEPAALVVLEQSHSNVACFGGNNGSSSVDAVGGVAPYSYAWSNSTSGTGITGVGAGSFVVTVTDANSCVATKAVTVTEPTQLVASSASQTNVSCHGGDDGKASVSVTGGTGTYTYDWTGTPAGEGTASVEGLKHGTTSVTVTDVNGCVATQSFAITEPPELTTSKAMLTPVACFGGATGSATVGVTGGTGAYTYSWSPSGGQAATANALAAGTYVVTVTDANACTKMETFDVTEPGALTVATVSATNLLCNGVTTGAVVVEADGGVGTYTYEWTGTPTGEGTASVSALAAGTHTVTVTDSNACQVDYSVTLTQPTAITATVSTTEVLCQGGTDGTATVTASGGTGTLTYDWAGTPTGDSTSTVSDMPAGVTSVTITDSNACTLVRSVTIAEPASLVVTLTPTALTCHGGSDGKVAAEVTGGVGPFTYDWSPNAPTGDGTSEITGLRPGTYSALVTDHNGCTATQSATLATLTPLGDPTAAAQSVTTPEETAVSFTLAATDPDCDALSFTVASQPTHGTLTGAAPNLTYTPNANYNGPDSFTFTASDSAGTSGAATVSITVTNVNDAPVAIAQTVTVDEDTPVVITLAGTDGDGQTLTAMVVTQPSHGTLSGTPPSVTYTPASNYNGADSFTFTVSDGQDTSVAATISLSVSALNDAPVATAQALTTQQDVPLTITLAGNDVEMSSLTFNVVMQPAHGTLSGSAPNLTYTPNAGYSGTDSFTFTVSDGAQASTPVTVSIVVTPVSTMMDGGVEMDGGMMMTDAGSNTDAGSMMTDAGTQPGDAGVKADAGMNSMNMPDGGTTTDPMNGGCSCGTDGGSMAVFGLVAMVVMAARRRRVR